MPIKFGRLNASGQRGLRRDEMKGQQCCLKVVAFFLVAAISPAQSFELIGLSACTPLSLPVAQVSAPPTQYADFCRLNPGHCDMIGPTILPWDASVRQIIGQVNRAVNCEIEFVPDPEWQGEEEVWSYPLRGRGDCEDFALEKRRRLVEIGFPRASLTMAIVHHKAKLSSHAVLSAETSVGTFVLDNMSDDIRCWSDAQLNYETRERPDGQWTRFDQSMWTFETSSAGDEQVGRLQWVFLPLMLIRGRRRATLPARSLSEFYACPTVVLAAG